MRCEKTLAFRNEARDEEYGEPLACVKKMRMNYADGFRNELPLTPGREIRQTDRFVFSPLIMKIYQSTKKKK